MTDSSLKSIFTRQIHVENKPWNVACVYYQNAPLSTLFATEAQAQLSTKEKRNFREELRGFLIQMELPESTSMFKVSSLGCLNMHVSLLRCQQERFTEHLRQISEEHDCASWHVWLLLHYHVKRTVQLINFVQWNNIGSTCWKFITAFESNMTVIIKCSFLVRTF